MMLAEFPGEHNEIQPAERPILPQRLGHSTSSILADRPARAEPRRSCSPCRGKERVPCRGRSGLGKTAANCWHSAASIAAKRRNGPRLRAEPGEGAAQLSQALDGADPADGFASADVAVKRH